MNSFCTFLEGLRMWADRASMGELLNAVSVLAGEFNDRGLRVTFKTEKAEVGDVDVPDRPLRGDRPVLGAE